MSAKKNPSTSVDISQRHAALVAQACKRIDVAEQAPSLNQLADQAGLSPHYFHRVFKGITGLTPKAYADAHRANAIRARLATGSGSVTDAIFDAGYNANSRFYEQADAVLGMQPRQYRAGGADTRIMFALAQCSLGAILVARSEKGVCAISLGDDADALLRELQDRFPRAELIGGDAAFEQLVANVIGLIEAPLTDSRLVSELWLRDEMVIYTRADHPFIQRPPARQARRPPRRRRPFAALGHGRMGLRPGARRPIRRNGDHRPDGRPREDGPPAHHLETGRPV